MNGAPIHVATFSLTGHTREAATRLLAALPASATGETVHPVDLPWWPLSAGGMPRGILGLMRAGRGMRRGEAWPIGPGAAGSGDLLVLAAPVWWGRLPPPMRSYVREAAPRFRSLAILAMARSGEPGRLFDDVAAEAGRHPVATLCLSDAELRAGDPAGRIADFAARLVKIGQDSPALAHLRACA